MDPRDLIVGEVGHLEAVEALQDPRVDLLQVGVGDVEELQLREVPENVSREVPDLAPVDLEQLQPPKSGNAGHPDDLKFLRSGPCLNYIIPLAFHNQGSV